MVISSKVLKDINNYIHKKLEYYSKISNTDMKDIVNYLEYIFTKYNIKLDINKFIEMRDVYMYILSKSKGTLANKHGPEIINDYNKNIPIIKIAKRYKLPPMSILYQILIELKYESHIICKLLKSPSKLPKILRTQLPIVLKHTPLTWIRIPPIDIYSKIKKIQMPFIYDTSQTKGKRPIIVFNELVVYKKKSFQWIEIKPFMLFDNKLLLSDANKSFNKFQRFGHGLVLYTDIICSRSFMNKLKVSIDTYTFFD